MSKAQKRKNLETVLENQKKERDLERKIEEDVKVSVVEKMNINAQKIHDTYEYIAGEVKVFNKDVQLIMEDLKKNIVAQEHLQIV